MPLVYIYLDKDNRVVKYSESKINTNRYTIVRDEVNNPDKLIGQEYKQENPIYGIRDGFNVAVIANYSSQCGISTYTSHLLNALRPKVDSIKIFSEQDPDFTDTSFDVEYCWKRGASMRPTIESIKKWNPSIVLIQHEFGIFPYAKYFLGMLEELEEIPYMLTLHSVYDGHRDKSVCTSHIKNIVVHTEEAKKCLKKFDNRNRIEVIPHGCLVFDNVERNFNIIGSEYSLMQFGFGFKYKGVDMALEAVKILTKTDPKFKDMFYCYYCSENPHCINANTTYYNELVTKVKNLGIQNNVSIQRGFLGDSQLNEVLRTYKMAIFPYKQDPANIVYGSSGAAKIAMANETPTIASDSHMFDDLETVVSRPKNAEELAASIDKIFSDGEYRDELIKRQTDYVKNNSWDVVSDRYLKLMKDIAK